MRWTRTLLGAMLLATLISACGGSTAGTGQGAGSSQDAQATQNAQATQGGGGGGGGRYGSLTYRITGQYQASGTLPMTQPPTSNYYADERGWGAFFTDEKVLIQLNTAQAGQIFNFGDGTASVVGTSDPGSGTGCTFTLTKNDPAGVRGRLTCTSAILVKGIETGRVNVTAEWNGHP